MSGLIYTYNKTPKYCCNYFKIRYIKLFFPEPNDGIIQISQLAVYSNDINIAPNGTASAANLLGYGSSIESPIDGNLISREFPLIYHSYEPSEFGYWLLDLGSEYTVNKIVYYNRITNNERANGMVIETYNNSSNNLNKFILDSNLIQTFNL
jgi:hypothetical protein